MSHFIIQISESRLRFCALAKARSIVLFIIFFLSMGANCGQAPTEICVGRSTCDDAWLTYIATSPEPDATGVSDRTSVTIEFNRAFESVNSSFITWSSSSNEDTGVATAVPFAIQESENSRSITLVPSSGLTAGTVYIVTLLPGAAISSDGESTPRFSFSFTTGLPSFALEAVEFVDGLWPAVSLRATEELDADALNQSCTWQDGTSTLETLSIEDVSTGTYWVLPARRPSGGSQTLTVAADLRSSSDTARLGEALVVPVPLAESAALSEAWEAPEIVQLALGDLTDGVWNLDLAMLPSGAELLLLELEGTTADGTTVTTRSLATKARPSFALSLSSWVGFDGVFQATWRLVDGLGDEITTTTQVMYDFSAPLTPILEAPLPSTWAFDTLPASINISEAGVLLVSFGEGDASTFSVEAGVAEVLLTVPRTVDRYVVEMVLREPSGNQSAPLTFDLERIDYPCLGGLVDGSLIQTLAGSSDVGVSVIDDDGEGRVNATVPLNLGLADDTTLHSALPNRSFGAETNLVVRHVPEMVTLIRFQVALIPECALVDDVRLRLNAMPRCGTCLAPTSGAVSLLREDWSEAQATWTQRSVNVSWALDGAGDIQSADLLSDIVLTDEGMTIGLHPDLFATDLRSSWSGLRLGDFDQDIEFYSSESSMIDARPTLELSLRESRE